MKKTVKSTLLFLFLAIILIACQPPAANNSNQVNANSSANSKWDSYVDQFLTDYFAANPTFAVYQGRHEFDGKFPDWSEEGLQKEISRLKSEREKAAAFKDADLDERQRF